MKKCYKCKEYTSDFYKVKQMKDGLDAACKKCRRKMNLEFNDKNPNYIKTYSKTYCKKPKQKQRLLKNNKRQYQSTVLFWGLNEWHDAKTILNRIKKEIRLLYNNTCQVTGDKKSRLECAHIYSKEEFPEMVFDINNMVLVTKQIHMLVDNHIKRTPEDQPTNQREFIELGNILYKERSQL